MWTSLENATATRASFAHKPRYFEFGCLWACGFAKKWESVDSKSLLRLLVCVPACVCVYVCEGALWQAAINRHAGAFMCVSVRICAGGCICSASVACGMWVVATLFDVASCWLELNEKSLSAPRWAVSALAQTSGLFVLIYTRTRRQPVYIHISMCVLVCMHCVRH